MMLEGEFHISHKINLLFETLVKNFLTCSEVEKMSQGVFF